MCTGFVFKGDDVLFGYNLDLPDGLWDFRVCIRPNVVFIGIRAKGRRWKTHGVNGDGQFGCLPYMNAPAEGARRRGARRLDQLTHDYIGGKLDYDGLLARVRAREVVNVPGVSLHGLFADASGRALLVEPGLGWQEMQGSYAAITNYPLLLPAERRDPALAAWYGVERREKLREALAQADARFGLDEGMAALRSARLTEGAPTRVSFVYSVRRRTVRYALAEDFEREREVCLRPVQKGKNNGDSIPQ